MKRIALVVTILAALASQAAYADNPASTKAPAPPASLSRPYVVTLGDMIALNITQTVPLIRTSDLWGSGEDVVASYDHETDKILVSIFGTKTSVDGAKAAIETFRGKVLPALLDRVAMVHHVGVDESDLTFVYVYRFGQREVLRREGAKYLVAE